LSVSSVSSPLIVAMDFEHLDACLVVARQLSPQHCRLKVGKELFTIAGPRLVEQLMVLGFDVFLDLKFHDIPNTVAKAVKASASLGVWMVNVHASSGERAMLAARDALDKGVGHTPLLIAVTVLTSMTKEDLSAIGLSVEPVEHVRRLAKLAKNSGMDGVVCSSQEASLVKAELGQDFILVTPGIRPAGFVVDDQRRVLTPAEAMRAGSDYLVIGRPITQAANPSEVCQAIINSLSVNG
jgi:orotidine-5'-phosphate decarboxylase